MDRMMETNATEPAGLSERPQEAGGDKSAGGPPAQRFSAKRKLRAVSRLLRGEPTPNMISQRLIAKSYPRETGGPRDVASPEALPAIARSSPAPAPRRHRRFPRKRRRGLPCR